MNEKGWPNNYSYCIVIYSYNKLYCLMFYSIQVPTSTQSRYPWREVWQQAHIWRPCVWHCWPCLSKKCYIEVGETYICGHLYVTSLLFSIFSPNPSLSIVLRCGGQLLNVTFSFLSARCIRWPSFVLIRISCCCVIDATLLFLLLSST